MKERRLAKVWVRCPKCRYAEQRQEPLIGLTIACSGCAWLWRWGVPTDLPKKGAG